MDTVELLARLIVSDDKDLGTNGVPVPVENPTQCVFCAAPLCRHVAGALADSNRQQNQAYISAHNMALRQAIVTLKAVLRSKFIPDEGLHAGVCFTPSDVVIGLGQVDALTSMREDRDYWRKRALEVEARNLGKVVP